MKHIEGSDRHQFRFCTLDDYITKDNPVRFIDALINTIELDKIGITTTVSYKQKTAATNLGGAPSFEPKLLLKLYLYGYLNKIRSSHKLEQECIEAIA